ncbi:MAG: hypothetical protein US86_C0010G0014 [Candidatus Daviesbacteria bacterium GW2011_GWA2_38_24]|uniref:Uncharacterized protein n=1 Tax=Candidatus Daviesbacteria bacterium GW2011_GWA2_38_24 TaxID=1618422 RepID=A0A0G0JR11_9BACT|nr:MAG: hypothetical protein US86_C0010G0014 [Candidatus Daviesbacteria bacterium GW2011_GWA2_38_24]KKQ78546.1 MAG: hypothetical protein UT01_C0067G0008 [Candidatus Daviesbacteria bacterium GW2011_GWA1_38_7]
MIETRNTTSVEAKVRINQALKFCPSDVIKRPTGSERYAVLTEDRSFPTLMRRPAVVDCG